MKYTAEYRQEVATTILKQLGGKHFILMTGSKHFVSDEVDGHPALEMQLRKNQSKANRLTIMLDIASDTYILRFWKVTGGKWSNKTFNYTPVKRTNIKEFECVYFDQLQDIFEQVTGLYTSLYPRH